MLLRSSVTANVACAHKQRGATNQNTVASSGRKRSLPPSLNQLSIIGLELIIRTVNAELGDDGLNMRTLCDPV